MEDVPEFERQILLGQGTKERENIVNRRNITKQQIDDNIQTLENLNFNNKCLGIKYLIININ